LWPIAVSRIERVSDSDALAALSALVEQGGDADDVLRSAVALLIDEPRISWASIRFLEEGELILGPSIGTPDEARRVIVPIAFRGDPVGELVVDGDADTDFLAEAVEILSAYVLLGWDTGGEAWEP
jgi:putative methionine-R-sulfoxide reductase with GAF domain